MPLGVLGPSLGDSSVGRLVTPIETEESHRPSVSLLVSPNKTSEFLITTNEVIQYLNGPWRVRKEERVKRGKFSLIDRDTDKVVI